MFTLFCLLDLALVVARVDRRAHVAQRTRQRAARARFVVQMLGDLADRAQKVGGRLQLLLAR